MPPWLAIALLPPLLGQVWIELPGSTPDKRAAVLRGCEAVLGPGECVATAEPSGPDERDPNIPPEASSGASRAVVLWSDDGERASLTFPNAPNAPARELRFDADDAEDARGEAVGLVVAAHVLGQRDAPRAARAPEAPTPLAVRAPREPETRPSTPRWALDLGLDAGSALDRGRARFGFAVRGSLRLGALPLYALASGEAARRFDAPRVHWVGGSMGLLGWLHTPWSRLDLLLHASGVVEGLQVSAERGGMRERGAAVRVGPRLGFELLSCPRARVCIFGGFRVQSLFPRVRLELQGNAVGNSLPVELGAVLGVRIPT